MTRLGEPAPDDTRQLVRTLWGGLLAVAGALAALAGFVYFIGALTLWLALQNRGYSADVAIEHQPRSQLIGLGLRGVLFVVWVAIVVLVARLVVIGLPGARSQFERVRFRYAAAAAIVLLLVGSLVSWRWLALAIAASTVLLVTATQLRLPARWQRRYWFALLVPAALTSVSWLVGGIVYVNAVTTDPPRALPLIGVHLSKSRCTVSGKPAESSYADLEGERLWVAEGNRCGKKDTLPYAEVLRRFKPKCSVAYFGENGDFVYLGAITNVVKAPNGTCLYDAGPIVELRRDKVRLRFLRSKGFLGAPSRPPILAAWERLSSFSDKLNARPGWG